MKKTSSLFNKGIISKPYKRIVNSKTFKVEILAYRFLKPYFNYQLKKRKTTPQYLILLCPARSGSTLLAHILNNNPELTGSFEHHVDYGLHNDLNKLIYRSAVLNNDFNVKDRKYFIDKMVYNYTICKSILNDSNVKYIFLLRNPHENLNSMATLTQSWKNTENALGYYESRINHMVKTALLINDEKRCLLINYEDLVNETDKILSQLKTFLKTSTPFTENYKTTNNTGELKYGDNSSTIQTGKIVHNKKPVKDNFKDDAYEKAEFIYQEGLKELSIHCTH